MRWRSVHPCQAGHPPRAGCVLLLRRFVLKRRSPGYGRGFDFVCLKGLFVLCRPGGDLLSRVLRHSTIGAEAFDGRVRDGIGSGHVARATRPAKNEGKQQWISMRCVVGTRALVMRAIKSNERLVPVSFTHCCASTSGLSTWWSSTALQGELVLRWVSRLDAFSGYPVRT